MRPLRTLTFFAAAALAVGTTTAFADTDGAAKFDPARMWECIQADGSSMYTNKERAGCKLMALKELSVVPSLDHMPTYRSPYPETPRSDGRYSMDRAQDMPGRRSETNTGWGREWHSTIAYSGGSIQQEVCLLYGEWINLVQTGEISAGEISAAPASRSMTTPDIKRYRGSSGRDLFQSAASKRAVLPGAGHQARRLAHIL